MRTASANLSVDLEPDEALEQIALTLLVLDEHGEVTMDANSGSAWMNTPWSWRSTGERVTLECEGRVIHVTSQSRNPALVDYGKNQANVDAVVTALKALSSRSDPSVAE
jgi:hypothetical protein